MELRGLIYAVEYALQHSEKKFHIYCDSNYCVRSFNEWIAGWAIKGWRRAKNQPVENLHFMQRLYELQNMTDFANYSVIHIKGHSNILGNELADFLATNNMQKFFKSSEGILIS